MPDEPRQPPTDEPTDGAPAVESEVDDSHVAGPADPTDADERVAEMLEHTIDVSALASEVQQQHAADAADTLETLEDEETVELLETMQEQAAAEALAEMQRPLAVVALQDLLIEDPGKACHLLELMAPDDAADLLQALEPAEREHLLVGIPSPVAAELRRLIGYDEESAGGLMTTDLIALRDEMTVEHATEVIRAAELPGGLQHLFVVDERGGLVGVVSLRNLLLNPSGLHIANIMNTAVRAVRVDVDREAVARYFDRYDYYMLAVVDEADRLLGVITVDDVIDIIRAEQTEDVQKTVGAGAGEAVYSGIGEKLRGRFPWLGMSLILTCFAAVAVLLFEDLIREQTILAFLLPVIAALVGNAGHQALAVTLRGIVLDEVRRDRVWPLVLREGLVGLLNGVVLGMAICLFVWARASMKGDGSEGVGIVAWIATAISMAVGTTAGSAIPLVMKRLGADPAQSSAIFLIMITDALAFSSLLTLTYVLLGPIAAVASG